MAAPAAMTTPATKGSAAPPATKAASLSSSSASSSSASAPVLMPPGWRGEPVMSAKPFLPNSSEAALVQLFLKHATKWQAYVFFSDKFDTTWMTNASRITNRVSSCDLDIFGLETGVMSRLAAQLRHASKSAPRKRCSVSVSDLIHHAFRAMMFTLSQADQNPAEYFFFGKATADSSLGKSTAATAAAKPPPDSLRQVLLPMRRFDTAPTIPTETKDLSWFEWAGPDALAPVDWAEIADVANLRDLVKAMCLWSCRDPATARCFVVPVFEP